MAYTPTFTPEYEDGWENLPSEDTPITASALNGYDGAIEAIEDYLESNDIVEVEANPAGAASGLLSTINIAGTVYSVSGGGGASALNDLTDVTITSASNGQVLTYNGTSQKWENGSGGGGGNTNMWTGTQAQYTAQASSIADGTLVNITDDETHVQAYDVYSKSEQACGQWIDGSTIYKKTIEFSTPLGVSYNSVTDTTIDTTNIGLVIRSIGINADGTNYGTLLADPTRSSHTVLGLQANRNGANANIKYLILEYTKTS